MLRVELLRCERSSLVQQVLWHYTLLGLESLSVRRYAMYVVLQGCFCGFVRHGVVSLRPWPSLPSSPKDLPLLSAASQLQQKRARTAYSLAVVIVSAHHVRQLQL